MTLVMTSVACNTQLWLPAQANDEQHPITDTAKRKVHIPVRDRQR